MSVFGKLLYKFYFQPKSKQVLIKKFGGKANYLSMLTAEQEMKFYALNELTIESNFNSNGKFKINFLTGDNLIHQTLFCTYSFFKFLTWEQSSDFSVYYYSDGTLSSETIDILNVKFPQINIVGIDETMLVIRKNLPNESFPYLNKKIDTLPLFKKLAFTHVGNTGLSTFFDSDMLFLKKPVAFLRWLQEEGGISSNAFCIQDVVRSYSYTNSEILKLYPKQVEHNINSGMYSIHSENMNFEFIEKLIREFHNNFGSRYYMEQLITAIILEKAKKLFIAPQLEYIVLPNDEQIQNQKGTLHHYVNESKRLYFQESWKKQMC